MVFSMFSYSSHAPLTATSDSLSPETCDALTFFCQDYLFALPLTAVERIVQCSAIACSSHGLDEASTSQPLLMLDGYSLRLVDLSDWLDHDPQQDEGKKHQLSHGFMIVTQAQLGNRIGLVTQTSPELVRLSLSDITPLSKFYQDQLANLAHHAVIRPQDEGGVILLLDLQALA
jgi:chemotaxis signal transduction protein